MIDNIPTVPDVVPLTSQHYASASLGRICSNSCACFHTESEVADQTRLLIQSLYIDTGLAGASADPVTSGAW